MTDETRGAYGALTATLDVSGATLIVEGWIERDAETGEPVRISRIGHAEIRPKPEPGAWRAAEGVIPWEPGDPTAEELIRRVRDNWHVRPLG